MKNVYIKPQVEVIKIENAHAFSASPISGQLTMPIHAVSIMINPLTIMVRVSRWSGETMSAFRTKETLGIDLISYLNSH